MASRLIEGPVAFADAVGLARLLPATGRKPRLGRQEIEPKRHRPRPTSFRRDWSIESNSSAPVTEYPPFDPPPVILGARERRR